MRLKGKRNAALFVGVSVASGFGGSAMSLVATVWVLALTGSSGRAALAGLCMYLPTLAGPALGAVVDRVPRRALLITTSLTLAASLPVLLLVRGPAQQWLIYAVMLGYGVNYVLNDAAESALLPSAVPQELLGRLNGWRMSAQESMKLVAPLAGAGIFAWAGGGPVALMCAAALLVSAGLYTLIRPIRTVTAGAARVRIGEGVRFLWRHRWLRSTVGAAAIAVAVSGFTTAALLEVVVGPLGRPAAFVGVLASLQGAGSIAAGLFAGRLTARFGETRCAAIGVALFGVAVLARATPTLPTVVAGAFAIGVALPLPVIATMTLVQRQTPGELLGRVAAASGSLMFAPLAAAIPAGAGLLSAAGVWPVVLLALLVLVYAGRSALRAARVMTSPDHGYCPDLAPRSAQ
ncbi:MAG: MFS transporter [Hamadaea sp.]|nr:MFS transporter [Hamadaea sp.]